MLPEQLLEIGCSEIGVYYIKIDNGYLLAFSARSSAILTDTFVLPEP